MPQLTKSTKAIRQQLPTVAHQNYMKSSINTPASLRDVMINTIVRNTGINLHDPHFIRQLEGQRSRHRSVTMALTQLTIITLTNTVYKSLASTRVHTSHQISTHTCVETIDITYSSVKKQRVAASTCNLQQLDVTKRSHQDRSAVNTSIRLT